MNKIEEAFKPYETLTAGTGKIFKKDVDGVETFVRSSGLFSRISYLRTPRATEADLKDLYEKVKSLRREKGVDSVKVEKAFATCINQFSSDSSLKKAAQKIREEENRSLVQELAKSKEEKVDIQTVKRAKAWLETLDTITLREEELYILFNDIQLELASQRMTVKEELAKKEITKDPLDTSTTSFAARRALFENRKDERPLTPPPKAQESAKSTEPKRSISDPRISETAETEHLSVAERMKMFNQGESTSKPTLLDKAKKSNLKVTSSSGDHDFVVHDKSVSRFPKPEAVVKALLEPRSKDIELNSILKKRGLEGPFAVKSIRRKQVSSGQTQSQGYLIQMYDGREFFCKVTNPVSSHDSAKKEKETSKLIAKHLDSEQFFLPMKSYLRIRQGQNVFDVILYENFDGVQLLKSNPKDTAQIFADILGRLHAEQLKSPLEMSNLLIHPDFNTSNVLVNEAGEFVVIDNCGMYVSGNEKEAYKNFHDVLSEQIDKEHFFEVYTSYFPEDIRKALIA